MNDDTDQMAEMYAHFRKENLYKQAVASRVTIYFILVLINHLRCS